VRVAIKGKLAEKKKQRKKKMRSGRASTEEFFTSFKGVFFQETITQKGMDFQLIDQEEKKYAIGDELWHKSNPNKELTGVSVHARTRVKHDRSFSKTLGPRKKRINSTKQMSLGSKGSPRHGGPEGHEGIRNHAKGSSQTIGDMKKNSSSVQAHCYTPSERRGGDMTLYKPYKRASGVS